MVGASRAIGNVTSMAQNGWTPPTDHPDVNPVNESAILRGLFDQALQMDEVLAQPRDFRERAASARRLSAELEGVLGGVRRSGSSDWSPADGALAALKAACNACHSAYRND